ncbi:MAG: hypothetical protein OXH75_24105 [Acidobacteria bacterium]|nr:hypothetical protein [Acidobacteriota bacterium]
MRHITALALSVAMLAALAPGEVRAQSGSGFYLSQELGVHFTPALDIEVVAPNAPGSICDEHLNPFTDLMPAFCSDPNAPGTAWTNAFDGAAGILAGGALGYRFTGTGRLRGELECFYRETAHNETSAVAGSSGAAVAKLDAEVVVAQDRIGSITSHNLFGNAYFDLTSRSRVTPYVGVGAGVGFSRVDHGLLWVRNSDPDLITSVAQYFPPDRQDDLRVVQQNLASTTTSNQTELGARLFGYQVLFGVDVALTESTSLGIKGRRVAFGSFSDAAVLERGARRWRAGCRLGDRWRSRRTAGATAPPVPEARHRRPRRPQGRCATVRPRSVHLQGAGGGAWGPHLGRERPGEPGNAVHVHHPGRRRCGHPRPERLPSPHQGLIPVSIVVNDDPHTAHYVRDAPARVDVTTRDGRTVLSAYCQPQG